MNTIACSLLAGLICLSAFGVRRTVAMSLSCHAAHKRRFSTQCNHCASARWTASMCASLHVSVCIALLWPYSSEGFVQQRADGQTGSGKTFTMEVSEFS